MSEKVWIWIVLAVVAAYYLLFKKGIVTGGANLSVATGNNATPYTGVRPGAIPAGTPVPGTPGGLAYGAPVPLPQPNSTAQDITAVASLVGAAGGLAGTLGGLFGGGGGGGGGGSYGGGGGSYDSSGLGDLGSIDESSFDEMT